MPKFRREHKTNPDTNRLKQTLHCNFCNYSTYSKRNMIDHCEIHIRTMPFSCRFCKRKFSLYGQMRSHEKNFQCLNAKTRDGIDKGERIFVTHKVRSPFKPALNINIGD